MLVYTRKTESGVYVVESKSFDQAMFYIFIFKKGYHAYLMTKGSYKSEMLAGNAKMEPFEHKMLLAIYVGSQGSSV